MISHFTQNRNTLEKVRKEFNEAIVKKFDYLDYEKTERLQKTVSLETVYELSFLSNVVSETLRI